MKTVPEIEAEAFAWILRDDAEAQSAADDRAFSKWYYADARHRIAYLRLRRAWRVADALSRLRPSDDRIDKELLTPRWRRVRPWLGVAAAAACAGIAVIAWTMFGFASSHSYSTGLGRIDRIVLADGSTVNLNTDSKIRVDMTDTHRRVQLLRGEAHFRVSHDVHRPFDVQARGTILRAIGTAFSVRLRDTQRIEVLVAEGRVAVGPPDVEVKLERISLSELPISVPIVTAGETAMVESTNVEVQQIAAEVVAHRLAWTEGWLVFDGQPLAEVIEQFNRYSERQIVIADSAIARIPVGGRFRADDPDSLLLALHRTHGIRPKVIESGPFTRGTVVQLTRE